MSLSLDLPPISTSAVELLDLIRDPGYMKLMGEGIAIGIGLAELAKFSPQIAVPVAFAAGIYFMADVLAWVEKQNQLPVIDVVGEVVETPELEESEEE